MNSYLNPGQDSPLGEKIGERSEPRGNLGRRKGWSPLGGRWARFARPYFSFLTPFVALFAHCGAWYQAKIRGTQRWFPPKRTENTLLDYPEYFKSFTNAL